MSRKTYEILAECFHREGVTDCFALLGDANMNWATALAGMDVRMIYVRHEHNTVAAASAYARKTGRVGVASVTCGPGLTQLTTALPAAVRAGLPLVIFAGEAPLRAPWYNQDIDQAPLIRATGADYQRLHHIPRMAMQIRDAFAEAQETRRPVVLGVPFDLQSQDWTGGELPPPSAGILPRISPMPPNPVDADAIASRIARARRIVVMAGMGAVAANAGPECRELAERLGALLATTLPARGLFHDDPFCLGIAGGFSTALGRACLAHSELVIAVGGRLAQHNTDSGKLFPNAEVIQVDTAPHAISQGRVAAHHHLRADARLGVRALLDRLPAEPPADQGWRSPALARAIAETPADPAVFPPPPPGLLDPREVVSALDAVLPGDWQMVNSSGHCSYFFAQMPRRPQDRFLTIREFGAIGNGLAYAMGTAIARPGDTVVLFDGDGSVLMNVQELETIRRHGLNILVCVLNDGAYGSEIHKLRDEGLPDDGAVFGRTDLAAIARGFGLQGERVDDLARVPELVADFAARGGAAIWDFPVSDRIVSPVIRRAHPKGHDGQECPIGLEGLS